MTAGNSVLLAAALWLVLSCAAHADQAVDTLAACAIRSSTGVIIEQTAVFPDVGLGEFPIDRAATIWERSYDGTAGNRGAWCYVNEEGRVRGSVITGHDDFVPVDAAVFLKWQKAFIRTPGSADPDFTITPSHLLIEAYPAGSNPITAEEPADVFAEMHFAVYLHRNRGLPRIRVFEHRSRMQGLPGFPSFEFEQSTNGDAARVLADGASIHPATDGLDVEETTWFATFELPSYTQAIQLERYGIGAGDEYSVEYVLSASAGEVYLFESRAEAFIGDPLDADTGFALSTVHEPLAQPLTRCEVAPDPGRYEDNEDGTVTDSRTGLMWQRCPAGFEHDDAGTPGHPADDLCGADAGDTQQFNWQGALQRAAAATAGGYQDWRVPNLKEIETLVEPCLGLAQIDPSAFPGTPGARFWTATPEPGDSAPRRAWQLDFSSGDLAPASRQSAAQLRSVRDTGAMLVPPGVSVAAGNASVVEGDSGTTTLALPVTLSGPLGNDVSVDYVVSELDATDGVDFTATAGTLTIPAGDTLAYVDVTVMGDTEVENNERVLLQLSNQSGATWLRKAEATGTIIDDEPIFRIEAATQVTETDSNDVANIVVRLDRPAVETISIDYATTDGSATAGDDYVAANGTVTIQPGDTEGVVPLTVVGDLVAESMEQLEIEFGNPVGAALVISPFTMTVSIVDNDGVSAYGALNDTGVNTCATGSQTYIDCPQAGYPGQDAEHGRDVTDADPSDGALGFSFLKRDAAGDPLVNQAALYSQGPWDCVEDQVTGLFWEVKNDIQSDLRFSDHTFTWYNSSGSNDGGSGGTANGGNCPDGTNCDTEKYVASVNAAGLCSFHDWRLPTADELFSIAWLSVDSFSGIDTAYFPNHFAPPDGRGYWSATPTVLDSSSALRVRLEAGGVGTASSVLPGAKSSTHRIRLVRGSWQPAQ